MRNQSIAPRPLTGRMVLLCLIAFFGTVIGVNMLMMKFAIDTLSGTEVDSAYRASRGYTAKAEPEFHAGTKDRRGASLRTRTDEELQSRANGDRSSGR